MKIDLRPFRDDDADAVAEACGDPVIARYLPFLPQPYTREDALAFFRSKPQDPAVVDPATDRVLGTIGSIPRGGGVAEVGYWVAPWARRRGVATAALELFSARLFEQGLHRLYLQTALTNGASQRVALAAGYTREGVARGGSRTPDGMQDVVVWARLAGDPTGPTVRALPDLPGGRLSDGVVELRPLTEEDGPATYELRSRPDVSGRSVVGTPIDLAGVTRQCAESVSKWLAGLRAELTIRDADGTYLGEIALFYAEPLLREAMIGYALTPEARGKGYAARAVRLVTAWGFEIGMVRMVAGTAPDNVASQRVLEAAGYHREALQRDRLPGPDGTRVDNIQFAKLRPAAT
jgi:RimJ/RimL family protein N-acetyltransferase